MLTSKTEPHYPQSLKSLINELKFNRDYILYCDFA